MRQKTLKIKNKDKLRVYWGYEEYNRTNKDLVVTWPMMCQGSCDASWIFSNVFTNEVRKEFERRGWDITTLRFSIAPKLVNPTRPERFTTLLKWYEEDIKKLNEENNK